ncbi:PAS domain-containing protein [Stenoxybacter acetivorans]|uniref:PAS domain-containing protein n=1 Tax=Stenoxybacter acetivorans TaxID=422441 RepID=UPI00056A8EBF|nr:PAS domain-containing protein [Stenoxybacter acetivorans]
MSNIILPTQPKPAADAVAHELHYWSGETRTVYTIDEELAWPDGHLIVSRTDVNGIITHANEAFVTISGWTRDELIGTPHCILRHPDMPKAAFADLWATVQSGKRWTGYVKNLTKNGAYYWVYATVLPNVRQGKLEGYSSIRRKPSRTKIEEMKKIYAEMRD